MPGLIKLMAWRRARDLLRNATAVPADPLGALISAQTDRRQLRTSSRKSISTPPSCGASSTSSTRARKAVIKLRFDFGLSGREIHAYLASGAKVHEAIALAEEASTGDQHLNRPTRRR